MVTPIDDRPAHKGYPHRLNAMGARIAEVFRVPESVLRPAARAGYIPDLDLLGDLEGDLRASGSDIALKAWHLDEIDPRLCSLCMGDACEYGCGQRTGGGCHQTGGGFGPSEHRVCRRCKGAGRIEIQ